MMAYYLQLKFPQVKILMKFFIVLQRMQGIKKTKDISNRSSFL